MVFIQTSLEIFLAQFSMFQLLLGQLYCPAYTQSNFSGFQYIFKKYTKMSIANLKLHCSKPDLISSLFAAQWTDNIPHFSDKHIWKKSGRRSKRIYVQPLLLTIRCNIGQWGPLRKNHRNHGYERFLIQDPDSSSHICSAYYTSIS